MARGQLVMMMTFGAPPKQRTSSTIIPSLEVAVREITLNRYEADLRGQLAQTLADAAVKHLGADRDRLEAAVESLSDPTSTVPISSILRGNEAVTG
jgi:hypothetical protein